MERFINVLQPDGSIQQLEDNQFIDLGEGVNYNPRLFALSSGSSGGSGDEPQCMYLVEFNPFNNVCTTNQPELIRVNNHPVLVFPKDGNKTAYFECVMPSVNSDGFIFHVPEHQWNGFYYVHLHWTALEGGTIGWTVAFENLSANGSNLDTDSFDPEIVGGDMLNQPNEVVISTIAFDNLKTNVDSKDLFRLVVKRNDGGTDDDVYLLGVDIQWRYLPLE